MISSIKKNWMRSSAKLRDWFDRMIEGTHDHYLWRLPGKDGRLSSAILKLYFSGIKLQKDQLSAIRNIEKDGIVVYASKYKSRFDFLFFHSRFREIGLPYPETGFELRIWFWQPLSRLLQVLLAHLDHFFRHFSFPDPYARGYIREELLRGRSALLFLIERRGFIRRFIKEETDPLRYLIDMQKSMARPIYVVLPVIFFGRKPHRSQPTLIDILFGTEEKPRRVRRFFTLFKNPEKVFVEISEPVNLREFLAREENRGRNSEHLAIALRRQLILQINRHRQSITGPLLKSREELKESILTGDRLRSFMDQYAKSHDTPISKVRKNADEYLEEIAASYNPGLIRFCSLVVKWIMSVMFEGISINADVLARVRQMSQRAPLILIPCHKSHIDYLVLSYVLYNNNMPCPHVAAGKNLSFWPMGPIFRGGGAFFIRRSFRGAVLYSKVFTEYLHNLLEEGFNIEFFIEGGRSRTGKLMSPKIGLLSILLNAYRSGACEDMIIAPIFIGYDRVLEESSYLHEIEGGQKNPESFIEVLKARKFLKKRYGKIYINFHEPISVRELIAQSGTRIGEMSQKEQNVFCRKLGHRVVHAINEVSVVTPHALVASAILNCDKKGFPYAHLMNHTETYLTYLLSQSAKLADTLLLEPVRAVEQVIDSYVQNKLIDRIPREKDASPEDMLRVIEGKRPVLEYYKNNSISFFIPAAFTALSILVKDAFQFSASDLHAEYTRLQEFFKLEFIPDIDKTPEHLVRKNIKAFINDAVLMPHPTLPDTYNVTSAGFRKLKLFSNFLKTYFESYWITLNFFMQNPQNAADPKDRLKKIHALGNRMYKRNEVDRIEALSGMSYQNAVEYFTSHGIKGEEDETKIQVYAEAVQKYLNYLP